MNVTGLRTLFVKEVRRFLRVPGQTVLSPLISTTGGSPLPGATVSDSR